VQARCVGRLAAVRAYPSGARAPSGYLCGIPRSFLRAARSCSRRCAVRARTRTRGVGGSDRVAFTATLCWEGQNVRVAVAPSGRIKERGEEPTQQRAVGKHNERPEVIVAILDSLKVDGAPRPRGRVLRGETVMYQPRAHQRHRVGCLFHLEDAEPPLHEGNDPPVVKVRENRGRAQPGIRQALQRE
jgi:hypothetical protein